MEKKIYSEEQLKEFGDVVWQKGKLLRQLQVLKEQYTDYYQKKLEAGVFTKEFVEAKLDAIEGGNRRGFIMAEHTPVADIGHYVRIQEPAQIQRDNDRLQGAELSEAAMKKVLDAVQRVKEPLEETVNKDDFEVARYNALQNKAESEKELKESAKYAIDDLTRAPRDEQEEFRKLLRAKLAGISESSSVEKIDKRLEKAIVKAERSDDAEKIKLTIEIKEKEQKASEDELENDIYGGDEKEFTW